MILKEWDPDKTLDELELVSVVYWVHIHGLPLELSGCMLGEILEMDRIEDHVSFIRLKIRFLATTPLQPGFHYYLDDGESIWIGFKYEQLSSFCIHCGLIDHTIGACFQNPAHPQNFALNEKMRGYPPAAPLVDGRTAEMSQEGPLGLRGRTQMPEPDRSPGMEVWIGQQATVLATIERVEVQVTTGDAHNFGLLLQLV